MTFGELRQEVKDSGLDHLSDARVNRFVNLAYKRIYHRELWPWRLAETSGAEPLAVVGTIQQVLASGGYPLSPITQNQLENAGNRLTETGSATEWWYLDDARSIATFPATGETISVRYYERAATMTSDSETPDLPEDYHYLIVLDAVRRGKLENGELDAATGYAADFNELFADLKRDYFNEHVAGPYALNDLNEGV